MGELNGNVNCISLNKAAKKKVRYQFPITYHL